MKYLNIIVLLVIVLSTQCTIAQKKSRGDRFFDNGDYQNAALQYEQELNREGNTKHLLQQISVCYYNIFQFRTAYRYLKSLTSGRFYEKDKGYDNAFNFKMYHVLSALGEYEKSLTFLDKYTINNTTVGIDKMDAIEIIEAFKLKDDDYTIENAGFNSKEAAEFGAIKRDSIIYFTTDRKPYHATDKKYNWTHRSFLDIYQVSVDENNVPKDQPKPISKKINSKLHEGNFCFSSDGNTMYFSKSNSEKGKKKFDSIRNNAIHLYKSTQLDSVWSTPEKLPFNDVSYSVEHPVLNFEGTRLYFASNMPGGFGGFDLYYVDILGKNTYGDPVNLGPTINTEHREQFPFVSKEEHLFFSSNGHLGLGMMDVFVSELKEEGFTQPVNLGAPINSRFDDFSLSYYNDTDGFFASNRNKVNDDVYSFSQIGPIFRKTYTTRFEVRDFKTERYIPNANVGLYTTKINKEEIYKNTLDSIGGFTVSIFPGAYEFTAEASGYSSKTNVVRVKEREEETYIIYLEKESGITIIKPDEPAVTLPTKGPKGKETLTSEQMRAMLLADTFGPPVIEKNGKLYFDLPPIYFDYDKWNIRADSKKVLDEFALKLDKYKSVHIHISSHTDKRGSDNYNKVLSEKRAESSRNYLALEGYVNARRMEFDGFGESQPLIDCKDHECSEAEHQINRRSEFEITKY